MEQLRDQRGEAHDRSRKRGKLDVGAIYDRGAFCFWRGTTQDNPTISPESRPRGERTHALTIHQSPCAVTGDYIPGLLFLPI